MSIPHTTPVIAEGFPVTFRDQSVWHDPNTFERSLVVNFDFDETCFTTFISSGTGVAVGRAYECAVETVLGKSAKQDFSNVGGLSNRAPLEVINGLLEDNPSLIVSAMDHAKEHFSHPIDKTDIGTGLIARFAMRGSLARDELTTRAITEMLVIRKKEQLMPQINSDWPKPVDGFEDTWKWLHEKRAEGGAWTRVHTAIVSSGHTDFIMRVMDQAGLPHPDVYMTDDEMRRQVVPRNKPDPFALELVRNAWMSAYLVPAAVRHYPSCLTAAKNREIYVGDDPVKDGLMARNDGMRFMHHDGTAKAWPAVTAAIKKAVDNEFSFSS